MTAGSAFIGYVDDDWVADGQASPPALMWRDGVLSWNGREQAADRHDEPDVAAGRALFAVAASAVATVTATRAERFEVIGSGFVARLVRRLLGVPPDVRVESPQAVVDTTGDADAIADATRRLAPMGTLALAGEPLGRQLELDLYPDVHVRGLRLVGVDPLLTLPLPPLVDALQDEFGATPPALVGLDGPLAGAAWYRVDG